MERRFRMETSPESLSIQERAWDCTEPESSIFPFLLSLEKGMIPGLRRSRHAAWILRGFAVNRE
jgi:hypothetical protein